MENSNLSSNFDFQTALIDGLQQLNLQDFINEQQILQLVNFKNLLQKWNRVYNLTAIKNEQQILTHHFLDCLAIIWQIQNLENSANSANSAKFSLQNILDVGSGAGFPGIILAICFPQKNIFLIDGVAKKCSFLRQVCIELKLQNTQIFHEKVPNFFENHNAKYANFFDLIISRAFADSEKFVELTKQGINKKKNDNSKGIFAAMKAKSEAFFSDTNNQQKFDFFQEIEFFIPILNQQRRTYFFNFK